MWTWCLMPCWQEKVDLVLDAMLGGEVGLGGA